MAGTTLREAYLSWFRGAIPVLLLPLVLTALVQGASSSTWWTTGPSPSGAARYLFLAVGAASVVVGRDTRAREIGTLPLQPDALRSLSWRLLTFAVAPVTIGVVLAVMTRQVLDFYAMLVVTLVGLVLLFPRYDQWAAWTAPNPEDS